MVFDALGRREFGRREAGAEWGSSMLLAGGMLLSPSLSPTLSPKDIQNTKVGHPRWSGRSGAQEPFEAQSCARARAASAASSACSGHGRPGHGAKSLRKPRQPLVGNAQGFVAKCSKASRRKGV